MKSHLRFIALITGLIFSFQLSSLQAQSDLKSPSEFLGYQLGSQWTPHYRVMDYVRHVGILSPLVQVEPYGKTYEGRELVLGYITSESNQENLEQIRRSNLMRVGLIEGNASADTTAIVWLSYNVHGNEASSSEAALKTLYELVRPGNKETKKWLQNTVVIMDPMLNPDGRDRYVHWYKETAGRQVNVHGEAREHHEPWPGGRTNHYYFDLNRDWAWLTQQETRQRVSKFQQWMPHIHVDFHEQGYTSPYYFAPAAEPFHNAITDWQRKFQYTIGNNHAQYFNQNNWLYFTREVFDLFYPSYGDTYPIFNGAIGMTYEQAGGGYAGLGIEKPNGDTLTLDDRLIHHFTTGLSTVEISSRNAGRLVQEFSDYYTTARKSPEGRYKSFIIKGNTNPDKLQALFELLDRHQVQYGKADEEVSLEAYSYQTGFYEEVTISEEDYVVSAYQPKSVLARVLFEPRPQLSDSLTYDITAWEQHYAFGVEGYALTEAVGWRPAEAPSKKVDNSSTGTPYAYLARWQDMKDLQMLSVLLNENIEVRFAQKAFSIENKEYQPGTLIILRGDNESREDFDKVVQKVANAYQQQLNPVATGFVQKGSDFGSSSVHYLQKPAVAVLSGDGTSSTNSGEIWHFFDQQIKYPVTMLDTGYWEDVDLNRYDVLILPEGNYDEVLAEEELKELKEWISAGGKLIAMAGANKWLAGKEGFSLKRKKEEASSESSSGEKGLTRFGERQRERISSYNAGAIYGITMDTSHPLAFGYDSTYYSLKLDADAYGYLEKGWNVGVAREGSHRSGFIGYKAENQLENTLTFGVQPMGQGSIVYMVDNPLFRAFWRNGKLLFGNAVFLVGQ